MPGKKDYFVLIGIDISGSTVGANIRIAKSAALAQATLCARMGIKFAVYAHSGNYHSGGHLGTRATGMDLDIYIIKQADEPWDAKIQERLTKIGPDSANLDGHSIEYYRKRCDERPETHKIILYYSDGKMPAENYEEELEILQREIKICKQKRYTLLGVGIRTDSPARHGLDTVQVDSVEEISKVVKHLERRLLT
jgi:cobalamin biosynthesis protein CobT